MQTETEIHAKKTDERRNASWDLRNAFGNYATLVVSQIAVALFSFASVTLCTRTLGAEGYGGIVAIIAASSVAQIFVNWSCIGLARFGVEEFVESGKISKSFWARTIIFLPNTLIFLAFSFVWFPLFAGWLKLPNEAYWLVVLHFFISAVWLHVQHAFQGAKLPRLQGSFLAIERVLIFGLLVILLFTDNLTWLSAVWAYIFPPFLMTILGLWQIRKLFSWKFDFDKEIFRKLLKFSVPLIPFSLIGYFSTNYLDAIFISQYLNKTELGIYSVAYQINGILLQFPVLAGSLLMPLFVTLDKEFDSNKKDTYFSNVLPTLVLFWSIGCVFCSFISFFLMPLIFGETFSESVSLIWIFAASATMAFPTFVGYSALSNSTTSTHISMNAALFSAFSNLLFNALLIPKFGIIGCAWATVIAFSVSSLSFALMLWKKHQMDLSWTFLAVFPTFFGAISFNLTKNNYISLVLSFCIFIIISYLKIDSIKKAFSFLITIRKKD